MPPTETPAPSAMGQPLSETCSVEVAAARLGLSRGKAYELARQNALPVPVLRFGRKLAVPVRALDRVLGIEDAGTLIEHGARVSA
jgi:Helix-turn-helix domain